MADTLSKRTNSTPLLDLLDQRYRDVISKLPEVTPTRPKVRPLVFAKGAPTVYGLRAKAAAEAHGKRNPSDPFAAARMLMLINQGFEDANEVLAGRAA